MQDPTDDIVADQALFPAVISAATLLNTDSAQASQLKTAESEIEPYPRVSQSNLSDLLNSQPTSASAAAGDDAGGSDVIGDSYQPSATLHNSENIGLEAVWPYGVIGDNTVVNGDNLTALADRTYNSRPNVNIADWSFDAVDAARLDMGSQVSPDLVANTEEYQTFISGLAEYDTTPDEPYIEQQANVATTLDEALATDYDGTLRFAPAWPTGWNGSGTVYIQGGSKVDVQVEGGTIATAAIQAAATQTMTVRNPWPGQQAEVVNGSSGAVVVGATTASTFSVPVTAGSSYLVEQVSSPTTSLPFAQVTGSQSTTAKHLGSVSIGLNGNAPPPVGGGQEAPYGGTAAAVPGTVQAANYDTGGQGMAYNVTSVNGNGTAYRSDGVDLESCTDTGSAGCGYDLGWTSGGQWFKYTVNVATAGTYTVSLRLASLSGVTDGLHIASSSGANLSGNINVPDTGAWQTWTTVTATVTLPAGQQTLTLDEDNGGWNIRYLTFTSSGTTSPGNTVTVTSPGNQTGTVGTAAGLQVNATDSASGQTLTYSATGLPAGLSISSSGLISGTPSTAATSNVTVTATDTTGASGSASFTWTISGSGTGSCGELTANQQLTANQSVASCNGDYTLIMQGDGNLVLYQGSTALWASNTPGSAADEAIMQGDGNFVLYTSSGSPVWASNTAGNSGAYLEVQNDGNVVIYSASGSVLWSTGTAGK